MKKIKFTKVGYEDLVKERDELDVKRVEAVKMLSTARDMGDRSENAAYKSARQTLSGIDRQLRFLNQKLRFAEIVQPRDDGVVDIGSTVVIDDGKGKKEWSIVGGYESDLSKGRISFYTPVGKALLGKRVNDVVQVRLPNNIFTIKLLEISFS